MDVVTLFAFDLRHAVDTFADDVEQTAVDLAGGHRNHGAGGHHLHAAAETVGGVHGDAAHRVLTDVLLALEDQLFAVVPRDF